MHNWVFLKIGNAPYSIRYVLQMEFVTSFFEFFGKKIAICYRLLAFQ